MDEHCYSKLYTKLSELYYIHVAILLAADFFAFFGPGQLTRVFALDSFLGHSTQNSKVESAHMGLSSLNQTL